jgi:hypothetical protein
MKAVCGSTLAFFVVFATIALATDTPAPSAPARMSKQTRMDLIRAFTAELVYVRTPFPMGKKGLTLKDGKISPGPEQLQEMLAMWGPSVKPGDQARITDVEVKNNYIHFEINGGPVRKLKWYQHITVSGTGGGVPLSPSDPNANPRGSYVDLIFDHYIPDLNPQQLKDLLRPVFDFNAKSAVEAYLDTVPPKVKEAILQHQVLVGMNRDMVLYAKGRPPKKDREKQGDTEYEEWIYGEPPQDVDFIRFVGDEVVRVETMKIDGEKIVRTQKEVNLESQPTVAEKSAEPQSRPINAPTLRRPGEEMPNASPQAPSPTVVPPAQPPVDPNSHPPAGPN